MSNSTPARNWLWLAIQSKFSWNLYSFEGIFKIYKIAIILKALKLKKKKFRNNVIWYLEMIWNVDTITNNLIWGKWVQNAGVGAALLPSLELH